MASYTYPLEAFTNNGIYNDSDLLDILVEVTFDSIEHQVDFTFYNNSLIQSSIATIYFDFDNILSTLDITNGPGTAFQHGASPQNLPSAKTLDPDFQADYIATIGSLAPKPQNGINPTQWVKTSFNIPTSMTFDNIISNMNSTNYRIGAHLIALPDGSSESMITTPEPATLALLGMGALTLIRKRLARKYNRI